jgi:hypothetical protein
MKIRNSLVLGFAATALLAAPGWAQSNNGGSNNSNVGGVLNSGPQGQLNLGSPSSAAPAGYNSAVLGQAQSLQERLAAAKAGASSCSGIRTFVRNPQPSSPGAGSAELERVKQEALVFLDSVKNPGSNLLAAPQGGPVMPSYPSW